MIILLAVLVTLILIVLGVVAVFSVLLYVRLTKLVIINGAYQAEEYRQAMFQNPKKSAKPVKQEAKGRSIVNSEELVDISELPWEEAYKAIEEVGNGTAR